MRPVEDRAPLRNLKSFFVFFNVALTYNANTLK